jgi:hypothetical protein
MSLYLKQNPSQKRADGVSQGVKPQYQNQTKPNQTKKSE